MGRRPAGRDGRSGFTIPARGAMMGRTTRRRQGGPARAAADIEGEQEPRVRRAAPAPARDRRTGLVAVPLVLLVAVAFLPALDNGFVDWDDELNFLENSHYRGLGWPQVRWAWSTFLLGVYQPLAWLLLEAQYVLFGARCPRLPPDQPAAARRQRRRPLCPDRGAARPLPARPLPPPPVGLRRRGGAGDGPVRGAPAPGRGGGLGVVPAVSALRPVRHAGGPGLSPRRR